MNATTTPAIEQAEIERHPAGERWMGMEVAAWRTPVRKPADCPQDKWDGMFPTGAGNTYAEHWSTPGSHEWDEDKVERLFLQADVAALLARQRQAFEAREARLREALEPSADTKAAYLGEFSFTIMQAQEDENGEPIECPHKVYVPWDTIKEIMAAIRLRAALGDGK